jgi:hypothetical protein
MPGVRPTVVGTIRSMAKGAARSADRSKLKALLSGDDRRSISNSSKARAMVGRAPKSVADLAALTDDGDWLVSMRALDLLEKIAHEAPELVQPFKQVFLGPLAESDKWEIRLQIVRAMPLLRWTLAERKRALDILRCNVDFPQTFVRAWALDSLATFAMDDARLMRFVKRCVSEFERSESKALQARARQIRARLEAT